VTTEHNASVARTLFFMRTLYFTIWAGKFIGQQYMSIYLRGFPFIDDFIVGMIMSMGYLITTVAQLVWGNIADHSKTKNRILNIALVGFSAGLLMLILPAHTSITSLIACAFLFYVFIAIPGLMSDSIVVENTAKMNVSFGIVKCFSSAGAGAIALVMFFLSFRITIEPVTGFTMAFFATMLALVPAYFLPPTKGHAYGTRGSKDKKDKNPNASFRAILQNRKLTLLLLYVLLMFIAIQATNVFIGIYYATEEGMNAGLGQYGLFYAICIGLETCLMVLGNRLILSLKIYHVFTLVGFAASFRSLILFLAPNLYVIQLCAIGHMLIFAPLWTRLAPYVNDIVPQEMQATGQAAWYMMAFGLGPMIGAALGGVIAGGFGIRMLFMASSAMLFVLTIVFSFLFRWQYKSAAA